MRYLLFFVASLLCADSKNQVFSDFGTPLPLQRGNTLVVGIVGGWERWDAEQRIVRRICLRLREQKVPGLFAETVENHKLYLAQELIEKAFDFDRNGRLDDGEKREVRLLIYGQSLGGAATVKLCRWLEDRGIAVRLAIVLDSIGRYDGAIPANVKEAANLYQRDWGFIRGQGEIRAADPERTKILGNWRYRYPRAKSINTESEP